MDVHWLLTGEEKSPLEITITDPKDLYGELPSICEEKDEIIAMLKSQVEDLKNDKADLMELLKLTQGNK